MKKISRILSLLLAVCLLAAMVAGCGQSNADAQPSDSPKPSDSAAPSDAPGNAPSGETVKIGVLLPMSGSSAYYGDVQLDGIEFCVDYVNRNGGIKSMGGAQVELVIQDSAGSAETGISAFEALVDSGVSAVVGPYNSGVAAATAPLAIQYGVPYVIVNATSENFMQSPNKYVYRTNTGSGDGDLLYSKAMEFLNEVRPDNPTDKLAIVYDSGDWGTAASATWNAGAEEMGYTVVIDEAVSETTTDLSTVVSKIKSEDVDVVIMATYSAATNLLVKQMHDYQCTAKAVSLGGGAGDINFIENCGESAEGVMILSQWFPRYGGATEAAQPLVDEFAATYGYDMPMEPAWGWLGCATIINALEMAGSADREAVADALYVLDVPGDDWSCWFIFYDGVRFGTEGEEDSDYTDGIRYNNNVKTGELDGGALMQVQNGEWRIVWPSDMQNSDVNY